MEHFQCFGIPVLHSHFSQHCVNQIQNPFCGKLLAGFVLLYSLFSQFLKDKCLSYPFV